MADYVTVLTHDNSISVCFSITQDKIFAIGEKMNELCDEAYMNGYNWEAFFQYYLEKHDPDILEGLHSDPEADMYAAYFDRTLENEKRAERFAELITSLVEQEEELYRIIQEEGDKIEWD